MIRFDQSFSSAPKTRNGGDAPASMSRRRAAGGVSRWGCPHGHVAPANRRWCVAGIDFFQSLPITRVFGLLKKVLQGGFPAGAPPPRLKTTTAGAVRALRRLVGAKMLRNACGGFPAAQTQDDNGSFAIGHRTKNVKRISCVWEPDLRAGAIKNRPFEKEGTE